MNGWAMRGLRTAILLAGLIACACGMLFWSRLRDATWVTGHVLSADGKPVGGATLYVQSSLVQGVPISLQTTHSDADGTFRFHAADSRSITEIYARLPGQGVGLFRQDPKNPFHGGSLRGMPIVMRLVPARQITARVVDWNGKPIIGVNVGPMIMGIRTCSFQPTADIRLKLGAKTDSKGRAIIDSIPLAGNSTLGVDDNRFALVQTMVPPPSATEAKIEVHPACKVDGTVTLDGTPVRGLVLRWQCHKLNDTVVSDATGKFQINRAPKGRLSFEDATTGRREDDPILPDTEVSADPADPHHVEIKMLKGTLLRIKVIGHDGKPIGKVRVNGQLANPPFYPGAMPTKKLLGAWGPVMTGEDGTTRVRLLTRKYNIQFSRMGDRMATTSSVDVGEGPTQSIVLKLPPESTGNRLHVQAIDAEGNPLRNGIWYESETIANGHREKWDLPVGPAGTGDFDTSQAWRRVIAIRAQCADEISELIVPPNDGQIVLRLNHVRLGSVQGVVIDETGHPIADAEIQIDRANSALTPQADDLYAYKVVTDPKGHFLLQGLYPGLRIRLTLQAHGQQPSESREFVVADGERKVIPYITVRR